MLEGKKGVILGVANRRSIAWAIAQSARRAGAEIALTYANERLRSNVEELAPALGVEFLLPCDVGNDEQIEEAAQKVGERFGGVDFLVHAIAFANRDELTGSFHNTSRDGYLLAQNISSYSLTGLSRAFLPWMRDREASILTLSYLGAERVVSNYNVMGVAKAALEASVRYLAADLGQYGIRVNAVSAGPIKTLSAAGVSNFSALLDKMPERTPLRRNVTAEEVGDASLFFLSPLSRAVTGEILYVDSGYHIMGV